MDNNETIELPRLKEKIDAFSKGITPVNNELPEPIFKEEKTDILPNFSGEKANPVIKMPELRIEDIQKSLEPDFLSVPMVTSIHPIITQEQIDAYETDEDFFEEEPLSSNLAKIIGTVVFLVVVSVIFYFVAKKYLVLTVNFNDLIK